MTKKVLRRKWHRIFFLDYRLITKRNVLTSECPKCKTPASLERVLQRSVFEKIPRIFGFKIYHCMKCKFDGYLFTYKFSGSFSKVIVNYFYASLLLGMLFLVLFALFWFSFNLIVKQYLY